MEAEAGQKLPRELPSVKDMMDTTSNTRIPAARALVNIVYQRRWLQCLAEAKAADKAAKGAVCLLYTSPSPRDRG